MVNKIAIVTDTSSDIPRELAKKNNIYVAEAYVQFGPQSFTSKDLTMEEFYQKVESSNKSNFPKTSQASAQDFMEIYENVKEEGYTSILSIHISNKLSGTINSANVAAGMIEDMDIYIVDTHTVSIPIIACILKAIELIEADNSIETIIANIEAFGKSLAGYFTLSSLDNLVRGGRIGIIKYRFGKFFNFKPFLRVGQDEIKQIGNARGFKKSLDKIYHLASQVKNDQDKLHYIIAHSEMEDEAKKLENRLKSEFSSVKGFITEIGIIIGVHTGRGGIFLMIY